MAAGQGFKTFTTGEVLSAADVNGYLMQGILVFASAAARDAAITSPQEGQFAYLKDTNITTYYTGSAWANVDSTGMTNPMTTTGDTIYSSSGSTPARLGIGTTGQILTVSGGVPSWATPAGGGGMTLLSTTALTGASVNVTGIDQSYVNLYIIIDNINYTPSGFLRFRPLSANPNQMHYQNAANVGNITNGSILGASTTTGVGLFTAVLYNYASTTQEKNFSYMTTFGASVDGSGFLTTNTAVTNIAFDAAGNTFTSGTMRIYGVK